MADRPFKNPLPADLPEDWTSGQTIAPMGADVGLSEQHGYNYLMKQVNDAQRALNAVNDGFETISGKRSCRFVVGASAAGWTKADCDYLCDGTDDQVEIQAAIDAAPSPPDGGCEIVLLDGEYHLSGPLTLKNSVWLHGNGRSTRMVRDTEEGEGTLKHLITLYPNAILSDLAYFGRKSAEDGCFELLILGASVQNVSFLRCGYGCIYIEGVGQSIGGDRNLVTGCAINSSRTFVFVRSSLFQTHDIVTGNLVDNVQYLYDCKEGAGGDDYFSLLIAENQSYHSPGSISLHMWSTSFQVNVIVSNNVLSAVEVQFVGRVDTSNSGREALIYGNILTGVNGGPAVTLGPNTAKNFVFGNFLYDASSGENLAILDQGSGNIVFGNSGDTGGGGSGGGTAGVSSFKGRTGTVSPQTGDYTAAMVGAIPTGAVTAIQEMTQAEYDALAAKDAKTLYLIKE